MPPARRALAAKELAKAGEPSLGSEALAQEVVKRLA
jgi:hypothetical protein